MADRIIFRLKHDGETLAYLYQRWGRGDGAEIERLVRKSAKKYKLDLTKRADAIQAVRIAGEEQYGHALWNFIPKGDKDKKFAKALKRDLDYLKAHRDELIADNQDEGGIVFFYGTFEDYPAYIDEWCEDEYTMTV
jgi:hypothetical protein